MTTTILSVAVLAMTTQAKEGGGAWCEQQWRVESAKAAQENPRDYAGLLKRWQEYRPRCAGSVSYEGRLAIAYLLTKQTEKAIETLKPFAGAHSEYGYLIDFASLLVDYFEVLNSAPTRERVARLEHEFRGLTKKHPEFADAHAMLGGLQSMLGQHGEAIRSLELGLRSSMDVWSVYRNLTISYTAVGRYEQAIRAGDEAYRLNQAVTADQYFAYALAKADAAVGKLQEAETVLRVIAAKKPEVRRDPEFKGAVDFVTARMDAAKTSGPGSK